MKGIAQRQNLILPEKDKLYSASYAQDLKVQA